MLLDYLFFFFGFFSINQLDCLALTQCYGYIKRWFFFFLNFIRCHTLLVDRCIKIKTIYIKIYQNNFWSSLTLLFDLICSVQWWKGFFLQIYFCLSFPKEIEKILIFILQFVYRNDDLWVLSEYVTLDVNARYGTIDITYECLLMFGYKMQCITGFGKSKTIWAIRFNRLQLVVSSTISITRQRTKFGYIQS